MSRRSRSRSVSFWTVSGKYPGDLSAFIPSPLECGDNFVDPSEQFVLQRLIILENLDDGVPDFVDNRKKQRQVGDSCRLRRCRTRDLGGGLWCCLLALERRSIAPPGLEGMESPSSTPRKVGVAVWWPVHRERKPSYRAGRCLGEVLHGQECCRFQPCLRSRPRQFDIIRSQ